MRNRQVRWFDKNNVEDDVSRYDVRQPHAFHLFQNDR